MKRSHDTKNRGLIERSHDSKIKELIELPDDSKTEELMELPYDSKTKELIELARAFIRLEQLMKSFYEECAIRFYENYKIFHTLAKMEAEHASIFEDIIEMVIKNPELWSLGQFNMSQLTTMIEMLEVNLLNLRENKLFEFYALTYISGVELSVIEGQFTKAFIVNDEKVQKIIKTVENEYIAHCRLVRQILPKFSLFNV